MNRPPFVLVVLDGWGFRESKQDNAIAEANTPFFNSLWSDYPHSLLAASEEAVGLPKGQIGNSEVGHMTMGTGRITDVELVRIGKAIESGEFADNPAFAELFAHVKKFGSILHVYGLVSSGGVHSHEEHLYAFLKSARGAGVGQVAIHAFTDGRDVAPRSGAESLKKLEDVIASLGIGFIASVSGRYYAMDRDHNWDRTAKAESAIMRAEGGIVRSGKPSDTLTALYEEGGVDEHIKPMVFADQNGTTYPLRENDSVMFINFRADRARQLSERVLEKKKTMNLMFVTMTEYDKNFDAVVAFPFIPFGTTLAAELSKAGLTQVHIAETEKYAHVTYFFNGGREEPHEHETRILVDSRKDVPTHDLAPEMRAEEITDKAVERIAADNSDFIVINYANADMVGHTAVKKAVIKGVETIDRALSRLVGAVLAKGGTVMITADHGNAEMSVDPRTHERHTAHTTNPVPCIVTVKGLVLQNGSLADVAPTILELMGLSKPATMTGISLIRKQ
jgi:2,3-bisphosphoglycerate-independent phosphoglycerate mutase